MAKTTPAYEEDAWQIFREETAEYRDGIECWHDVHPLVREEYVRKVFEKFCYDKRNNDHHWRLKAHDGKVYDYWPSSGKWRPITQSRAEIDPGRLYEALTGKDPWDGVEIPLPREICEDCGAMAFGSDELLHSVNCVPGDAARWAEFYSNPPVSDDDEEDE